MSGYADVLVGLQYGDEGKAKVIDLLANDYDIVARFNGGANAGHTVVTGCGTAKLRQVPSGVLHKDKILYIGSGCAVNILKLAEEIEELRVLGFPLDGRLFISSRAKLIQASHIYLDHIEGHAIGTTGNGIGPCYADLALRVQGGSRLSLQFRDLIANRSAALDLMCSARDAKSPTTARLDHPSLRNFNIASLEKAWISLQDFIVDDPLFLAKKVMAGERVLFEGAQSVLLDVSAGDQPFVTSSHTIPDYAYVGGDLSCKFHRKTIGVVKAIVSRVGNGSFPSELGGQRSAEYCAAAAKHGRGYEEEALSYNVQDLFDSGDDFDLGLALRLLTKEYGTGSGRPRRLGLLDLKQLQQVVTQYGVDEIFINKIDCLTYFSRTREAVIPVIEGYDDSAPARTKIRNFPVFSWQDLGRLDEDSLPPQLKDFLKFLVDFLQCDLRGIGVGPERSQTIRLQGYTAL